MSAPSSPTSEVWPVWTDFVDNWRATDAHWFRDRVVNVFDNAAARSAALTSQTLVPGGLSFLQDVFSLEFYKSGDPALAASWESVRYPNLAVTSDATTITLRRTGAGSGIILQSDGYAAIEKLNAGLGTMLVGVAGVSIKTGTKTVMLTTDTSQLLIDSPVRVAGALTATGALSGTSLALTAAITGVTAITATGTVQGASVIGTTDVRGATVYGGGIASLSAKSGWAALQHTSASTGTTSGFFANASGDTSINGTTNTVNGTLAAANALTVAGATTLSGTATLAPASSTAVPIAGLIVRTGTPTTENYPNGTIWIQI